MSSIAYFEMLLQKKIELDRNDKNRKIALKTASAAVSVSMLDWYAWGREFDAALDFNFILNWLLMSISGWGRVMIIE